VRLSLGFFHNTCTLLHAKIIIIFFFFFLGSDCVPHYLASFVIRNTKIPLMQELVYMGWFAKKISMSPLHTYSSCTAILGTILKTTHNDFIISQLNYLFVYNYFTLFPYPLAGIWKKKSYFIFKLNYFKFLLIIISFLKK
jgi:hypothetical protein